MGIFFECGDCSWIHTKIATAGFSRASSLASGPAGPRPRGALLSTLSAPSMAVSAWRDLGGGRSGDVSRFVKTIVVGAKRTGLRYWMKKSWMTEPGFFEPPGRGETRFSASTRAALDSLGRLASGPRALLSLSFLSPSSGCQSLARPGRREV